LLDRSCSLVDFKCVLNQLPGDTGHVRRAPCEDVSIVPEETGGASSYLGSRLALMTTSLDASGMPRQTLLTAGLGSKAVLLHFYSGTSRVVWTILAIWATITVAAALTAESLESSTGGAFAVVGDHDVHEDGEDSIWRRHLHDE
jgi:hypothetical protein